MSENFDRLLERFKNIVEGRSVSLPKRTFKTYAISNFRGGIGKTTLAFNLAWELSRQYKTLLLDVCPQRNFTQCLLGDELALHDVNIYDALLPRVLPGQDVPTATDLTTAVEPYCTSFKRGMGTFIVPGSNELFLFPSLLYSAINQSSQLAPDAARKTIKSIVSAVNNVIHMVDEFAEPKKIIIDTSPFFGGATHLAWIAADALIIPIRVDQHSIEAFKLTISMLRDENRDFLRMNSLAGIAKKPKIHAVAMTHCGWNRQSAAKPDRSSQAFLKQVTDIVFENSDLFSSEDPIECIHLLDDFHSAGRISGSKRIPLAKLQVGESHVIEGQRLEVNVSLTRYQRELKALASML